MSSVNKSSVNTLIRSGTVSTPFSSGSLPAVGGWLASNYFGTGQGSKLTLFCAYDAAGVGGRAQLSIFGSSENTPPELSSDDWYELSTQVITGSTALAGAIPMNVSGSTLRADVRTLGMAVSLMPAVGATDKVRQAVQFDVSSFKYVRVFAHEAGNTGAPGTLGIKWNISG